jgi:5-(carboxyamino)imidazole ribonucleotide mutase
MSKKPATKKTRNQDKVAINPIVGIVMGSNSDWPTLKAAAAMLDKFDVPFEARVVSAHRTPGLMFEYGSTAEARGLKVIIAAAGGAAHLPGMIASLTVLPVIGVPVESRVLRGIDSLLSIVQMPRGVPVGTVAIGEHGAANAALLAVQTLALADDRLRKRLHDFRNDQTAKVMQMELD